MQEKEIDLRLLFYKALKRWRNAIIFGIIIAVLTAAFFLIKDLGVLFDPESLNAAKAEFEIKYGDWEAKEKILNNQMENIRISQSRQIEYNEKSIMMKIDPLQEYVGTMTFYVDSGYQIMPNLNYQNIDYTGRIMSAYGKYMSNGELYEYVLKNTDQVNELKYLKEILTAYTDVNTASINISVLSDSEAHAKEILQLVKTGLENKAEEIKTGVSKHTLTQINESIYAQVDFELDKTQKANEEYIVSCNNTLQEVALDLEEWKKEPKPSFEYTTFEITKHFIKMLIIGGVIGVFVGFGYYAMLFVLTGKLMEEHFWKDAKIYYLGSVWEEINPHKNFKKIDAFVDKFCGVKPPVGGFEESCKLLAANIEAIINKEGFNKTALIGTEDKEVMEKVCNILSKKTGGKVFYAGNILENPEAVKNLENCDSAIIAARENKSLTEDILRQKELLSAWNKKLAGGFAFK